MAEAVLMARALLLTPVVMESLAFRDALRRTPGLQCVQQGLHHWVIDRAAPLQQSCGEQFEPQSLDAIRSPVKRGGPAEA